MSVKIWRFAALMLGAFSLSLSMTHLLEFPQRMKFSQELWAEVTVFAGVYAYFGSVGAVFELGAIIAAFVAAFLLRKRKRAFRWTLAAACLLLTAFASWIVFVSSANAELAAWLASGAVPPGWRETRDQWEYAHAVNAFIKIAAFGALVASVITETPGKTAKLEDDV